MPAFNFQSRFAEDVRSGKKRQTIRVKRKDKRPHAKVGDRLTLYTGMRTKRCEKLLECRCVEYLPVAITRAGSIYVDNLMVPEDDLTAFAQADGFESYFHFMEWVKATHGLPFKGGLIKW